MNWVNDRLEQRRKAEQKRIAIGSYVEVIYNDLWNEILARIDDAKAAGFTLFTNGSPFERIVRLSVMTGGNPKELKITLDRQKQRISVSGLPSHVIEFLPMDLREDGVVCLKHKDQEILNPDAAKLVPDPFFFPEFAGA